MPTELPELLVPDAAGWREWLTENHAGSAGVWLVLTRKGGTVTALTYASALDEALCFGWIDGQAGRRDEESSRQRFTPRTSRSGWSARNTRYVARLSEEDRMQPAGMAAVEAAKADGRWDRAYAGPATAVVAPDLQAALDAEPHAAAMWLILTSTNRYAVIYRVEQAKRAETRQRRITDLVAMLARGETLHPQRATLDQPSGK